MIGPSDIALRACLAFVAGIVIGVNRQRQGRPAGVRTMILVCVAATMSMLLAQNWPGPLNMDAGRVAQGILTGVGFLGAGCIVKEGEAVRGVTTAATLWCATIIGLLLGAGEMLPAAAAFGVVVVTLYCVAYAEHRMMDDNDTELTIVCDLQGPSDEELERELTQLGARAMLLRYEVDVNLHRRSTGFRVMMRRIDTEKLCREFLNRMRARAGVLQVVWAT